MKLNMNEETLIAYLYGECNAEERALVEKYFMENPAELQKYKEMLFAREALGKVTDKEVIAPPIFMNDDKPVVSLWRSGFVRYATGIAAAFVMMMLGAKLLGVQVNYSGNEFTMSFGVPNVKEKSLTPAEVESMINQALGKNNELVMASWNESQIKFNNTLKENTLLTSQKINEMSNKSYTATQDQIRQFMQTQQRENNQALQDYIRLSTADQKQYIESLLVDFAKYMAEQRNQDLNVLNTRLNTLEADNNQFKNEAGQILTSLISSNTNNNSTVRRN